MAVIIEINRIIVIDKLLVILDNIFRTMKYIRDTVAAPKNADIKLTLYAMLPMGI